MSNIINSTQINKMENINTLDNSDIFIFSKVNGLDYSSNSISSNAFFENIKTEFSELSTFNPKGTWSIENKGLNILNVDTLSGESAINVSYANTAFLDKILTLSSDLYNSNNSKLHHPSYIGQIIFSNYLDSNNKLTALYGANTKWKQIKGRFILGEGENEKNTNNAYGKCSEKTVNVKVRALGGQDSVSLSDIPKHSHRFNIPGVNFKKLPEKTISFALKTADTFDAIDAFSAKHPKNNTPTFRGANTNGLYLNSTNPTVRQGGMTKSKTFSFTAEALDINENNSSETAHSNMPPFIAKYIWERIA